MFEIVIMLEILAIENSVVDVWNSAIEGMFSIAEGISLSIAILVKTTWEIMVSRSEQQQNTTSMTIIPIGRLTIIPIRWQGVFRFVPPTETRYNKVFKVWTFFCS